MSNNISGSEQLNSENPWPGLEPFEESAHSFFFGRDGEAEMLLRSVLDAPITILYGRSGHGKTSLLRAALFPALRARNFLPIYIRLDFKPDAPPIADQLRGCIRNSVEAEAPEARLPSEFESVWEYLHRTDLELWNDRNFLLTPVIVIDQFEEVFTLGQQVPDRVQRLRDDFGDLVENRLPSDLAFRIEQEPESASAIALRSHRYKLLISLREDFLPDLEGWQQLIPSFGRSRLRLLPLSTRAALEAVYKPAGHIMTHAQAERVVRFIAGETDRGEDADLVRLHASPTESDVEPALLSLFCRELNLERKRRHLVQFDDQLIEGAKRDVLQNYYERCIRYLPIEVARFVENDLITQRGFRNSYAREDAVPRRLNEEQLNQLIHSRLVRIEERYGTQHIELSHDVLTSVIRARRDQREADERAEEAEARRQAAAEREKELERKHRPYDGARWRFRWWPYLLFSLLFLTLLTAAILSSTSLPAAIFSAAILALFGFPFRYFQCWFSFTSIGATVGLTLYLLIAGAGGGLLGWAIAVISNSQVTSSGLINGMLYGIGGAFALRADFGSQVMSRVSPTDYPGGGRAALMVITNWVVQFLDNLTYRRAEAWLTSLSDDQLAFQALLIKSNIVERPSAVVSDRAKKVMLARLVQGMEMLADSDERIRGRADLIIFCARYHIEEHLPRPAATAPARS